MSNNTNIHYTSYDRLLMVPLFLQRARALNRVLIVVLVAGTNVHAAPRCADGRNHGQE